jgi:hypothetical protein
MAPRDIYSQALVGIDDNIKKLASVIDEIKNAIDKLVFRPIFEDNVKNLKTLAQANMVNPSIAAEANKNLTPLVEGLRKIQDELSQTYKEMRQVQATMKASMTLLQDRNYPGNPDEKTAIDNKLTELQTLNIEFEKTLPLLQEQAMTLAHLGHFAQPKQREKLDEKLEELHKHAASLKTQSESKKDIVDAITRPKPGKY